MKLPTVTCFVDFAAEFGQVDRSTLCNELQRNLFNITPGSRDEADSSNYKDLTLKDSITDFRHPFN